MTKLHKDPLTPSESTHVFRLKSVLFSITKRLWLLELDMSLAIKRESFLSFASLRSWEPRNSIKEDSTFLGSTFKTWQALFISWRQMQINSKESRQISHHQTIILTILYTERWERLKIEGAISPFPPKSFLWRWDKCQA